MRRDALAALLGAMVVGGASEAQSAPAPAPAATHAPGDPWERLNRFNYAVEGVLDRDLIGPLARLYKAITPGPIGRGIHNAVVNLSEPSVFVNDVLQLRLKRAGVTGARFVTNSTIGLFGLIDVAGRLGLQHHNNEFGVTLGRYGFYAGPYIYLPLGGPTTVRDLVGAGVDIVIDPLHFASYAARTQISEARFGAGSLDARAAAGPQLDALLSDATDPYATLRSVYLQHKQSEIEGEGAPLDLPAIGDPTPMPAPSGAAVSEIGAPSVAGVPPAATTFLGSDDPVQSDSLKRALADSAALTLLSQPGGDLSRAMQLGRTAGGVHAAEAGLAGEAPPAGPSESPPPQTQGDLDLTLAALK